MFGRSNPGVVPPQRGPLISKPAPDATVISIAADHGGNNNLTSSILMAMIYFLATDSLSSDSSAIASGRVFTAGAALSIIELVERVPIDANSLTDNEELAVIVVLNAGACGPWLYDLISAAQKKNLSPENVQGYFASLGFEGANCQSIARFINSVRSFYPDEIHSAAFRANLTVSTWSDYRKTRASAGLILRGLILSFKELGILRGSDEADITNSAESPWDLVLAGKIRSDLKAYASIFLETAGTGIDKWSQGNKAVASLPSVRVKGAKVIFKKYLDLKNNTERVDAIREIAEFQSAENKAFW